MHGMTKTEETEHMQKLSAWLRGEAGRHMASMRVAKGAPKDSHALHLLLWADLVDQSLVLGHNAQKAENEECAAICRRLGDTFIGNTERGSIIRTTAYDLADSIDERMKAD